jgi:uncharacterized damage-inducible protein DinB
MDSLKYPIGKFKLQEVTNEEDIKNWIHDINSLSALLKELLADLEDEDLNVSYREGGWTIRQIIHHIADSHMNSFIRFKLALTEEVPTIKTYNETAWAELFDSLGPISASLQIIEGLHFRWSELLKTMKREDFSKKLVHPEIGEISLLTLLALYSWHGKHHLAHIQLGLNKIK